MHAEAFSFENVPASQGVQAARPIEEATKPSAHLEHGLSPPGLRVPAGQAVHLRVTESLEFPGAQYSQASEEAEVVEATTQGNSQLASEIAPVSWVDFPDGQTWQDPDVPSLHSPIPHSLHNDKGDALLGFPRPAWQVGEVSLDAEYE
jgi:hypothetical protein